MAAVRMAGIGIPPRGSGIETPAARPFRGSRVKRLAPDSNPFDGTPRPLAGGTRVDDGQTTIPEGFGPAGGHRRGRDGNSGRTGVDGLGHTSGGSREARARR